MGFDLFDRGTRLTRGWQETDRYRKLLLTFVAGAAGFAVNGFSVELYPGVALIFGGVFYLLIAALYGPLFGFAAALIASTRTLLIWGHPYAIPAFALEGLAVGFLARRRRPLLSDLIYWGVAGIPASLLIFAVWLKNPAGWAIALGQSINGLADVIVVEALLIFSRRFFAPAERAPELKEALQKEISERKRVEESLEASEKRFRALIENRSDAIVLITANATVLYAPSSIKETLDYSLEEFLGRNALEFIHPDDREETEKSLAELLQHPNGVARVEYRLLRRDGASLWMEGVATNLLGDPHVQAILVNQRDITKRKRAEEALRISEERFAKAFKSNPRPMSIIRLEDRRYIDVNERVVQMTGYGREEMIGRTPLELGLWQDVKDRDHVMQLLKEEGRVRELELSFRRKPGEMRYGLFSAEIIEIEGERCLLTTTDDITERKLMEDALRESEEKFSRVFHSSTNTISILTLKEGRYLDVNESFLHLFGSTREEVIGRTAEEIGIWTNPEDQKKVSRMLREQGSVRDLEIEFHGKGDWTGIHIFSADVVEINQERCVICSTRTITKQKLAEESLHKSEQRYAHLVNNANDII